MEPQSDHSRPLGLLERTCPVRTAIGVISGKWKPSILRGIHEGRGRYGELRREVAGISDQTLTRHLRELCADGVIARGVDDAQYRLTVQGEQLADIMDALDTWGTAYLQLRRGAE